jgi:hypothetical protein
MARRSPRVALVGLSVTALVASWAVQAPPVGAAAQITTVVTGLSTPRGIAFDGLGAMYVSESGVPYPGEPGLSHTGRVSRWLPGASAPSWSTSFESVHVSEDGENVDALGPEGISAIGRGCFKRSNGLRNGCQVRMIMSLSHKVAMAEAGLDTQQLGWLYRLDGASGAATKLANVGDQMYDWTDAHQDLFADDFPDSNPYGVLVARDPRTDEIRTFVADAGANTISEVQRDGSLRVVSYIPNETAAPFRDATPTCIAMGPDGMLYVATLHLVDLFVNGPGGADVWKVDPDASFPTAPTRWATGLTTATACTFDAAGTFWATEMFAPSDGPPGDLVAIPFAHPTQLTHVGAGQLPLPGGVAQGRDGALYVTVNAAGAPGSGAVVRVVP